MPIATNHRNGRLSCICSISCRSPTRRRGRRGSDREQDLEQTASDKAPRRDRRVAARSVEPVDFRIEAKQRIIHHLPNLAQRVPRRNALLKFDNAQQRARLQVRDLIQNYQLVLRTYPEPLQESVDLGLSCQGSTERGPTPIVNSRLTKDRNGEFSSLSSNRFISAISCSIFACPVPEDPVSAALLARRGKTPRHPQQPAGGRSALRSRVQRSVRRRRRSPL